MRLNKNAMRSGEYLVSPSLRPGGINKHVIRRPSGCLILKVRPDGGRFACRSNKVVMLYVHLILLPTIVLPLVLPAVLAARPGRRRGRVGTELPRHVCDLAARSATDFAKNYVIAKTASRSRRSTMLAALMYPPSGVGKRTCPDCDLEVPVIANWRRRTSRLASTANTSSSAFITVTRFEAGHLFASYVRSARPAGRRFLKIGQVGRTLRRRVDYREKPKVRCQREKALQAVGKWTTRQHR